MEFTLWAAIRSCSSALAAGTDSRTNIEPESSGLSAEKGGWPRPSFKWQFWQARELNNGPSPSEASVEDGAEIQVLRKMALPILKSSSRLKSILPEESEKALAVEVEPREVARPPGACSPCSSLVKSVVGASRPSSAASVSAP